MVIVLSYSNSHADEPLNFDGQLFLIDDMPCNYTYVRPGFPLVFVPYNTSYPNAYFPNYYFIGIYNNYADTCDGILTFVYKFNGSASGEGYINVGMVEESYTSLFTDVLDSDGDSIPDEFDLYPDDDTSYTAGISQVLYNTETGEIVAGVIIDSNGNEFSFGNIPVENIEDYTSEIIEGAINMESAAQLQANLENLTGEPYLTKINKEVEIDDDGNIKLPDGYNVPLTIERGIKAPDPEPDKAPNIAPGEKSTGTENDNEALKKIIDNTGISADTLKRLADYLKTNNDILAQISKKTGKSGGIAVIGGESYSGPTADEIGQSVKDKLDDPTNTYDSTTTDNLDDFIIDTDTKNVIGTKYSDRVTQFTDTIKNSDLFSLSSDLFSPPSSTTSDKTFDIGSWGGSSNNQVSIDMADYDAIWAVLRGIILIMVSYAAFKIVVTKHA